MKKSKLKASACWLPLVKLCIVAHLIFNQLDKLALGIRMTLYDLIAILKRQAF
jgi:hypothetical protein